MEMVEHMMGRGSAGPSTGDLEVPRIRRAMFRLFQGLANLAPAAWANGPSPVSDLPTAADLLNGHWRVPRRESIPE